jgi:ribosomal protein L40E
VKRISLKMPIAFSLLICVITFATVYASEVQTVTIDPLSQTTLTFNLNEGQKFSGSLSITGGSDNDINFWITDPFGNRIVDSGRVSGGRSFEFTTIGDGAYTLHFDNTLWLTTKTLTLTYEVTAQETPDTSIPTIILGLVILTVVLSAVAVAYYAIKMSSSRREKIQIKKTLPSSIKFCTSCGAQNDSNANYCKKCGKQLQ